MEVCLFCYCCILEQPAIAEKPSNVIDEYPSHLIVSEMLLLPLPYSFTNTWEPRYMELEYKRAEERQRLERFSSYILGVPTHL